MVQSVNDLKSTLLKERKIRSKTYHQCLWNSKADDYSKEAFRFVKNRNALCFALEIDSKQKRVYKIPHQ